MAPACSPSMAQSLSPDLLGRIIASLSDDDDRKAALAVCRSWHAAMSADPALWPTVELFGHFAAAAQADLGLVAETGPAGLLWWDSDKAMAQLRRAAAVPARVQRVRLRGFWDTPHTLYGHLALLPAGLTRLELACQCAGPLPAALQRFTALREIDLGGLGSGSEVDWGCRGAAATLARLSRMRLDCRRPEYELHGYVGNPQLEILDNYTSLDLPRKLPATLLAAATPRLRSLELVQV